jgi:V/A-type H+-transporting ATPase subunit A
VGVAVWVVWRSLWAVGLRDIAARLQEMPGEEGYPTSMASRLGALYERAGRATTLSGATGAVTLVCAVSPPGGDFSEPVTQASLRVAGGLWALDAQLARARQFPAVDWSTSYSLYPDASGGLRTQVIALLQRDAELREVASLVGIEEMEDRDRLVLAIAALVREHVLGQNAYDPNDAMSPPDKTHKLAELALAARSTADAALAAGAELDSLPLAEVRRAFAEVRRADPALRAQRIADCERAIGGLA